MWRDSRRDLFGDYHVNRFSYRIAFVVLIQNSDKCIDEVGAVLALLRWITLEMLNLGLERYERLDE